MMNTTFLSLLPLFVLKNDTVELLSDDLADLILKFLMFGLTPLISIFGIAGNVFSIMILIRHGLSKCSNVLLVSLAFADICYLVGFNNIPRILYDSEGKGRFIFSRNVSFCLFILYFVFFLLDYGLLYVGLTIPMLITVERLFAVFLPLKFSSIVTPNRTWSAVIGVGIYSLSYLIYTCFWYRFEYIFDAELNTTVGLMVRSDLFYSVSVKDMEEIYFGIHVQPIFTLIGCTLIIIKVKVASRKRKKMTSSDKRTATSKTTQILLVVCIVYLFVCVVATFPRYIPDKYMSYSLTTERPTNLGLIMYQVINIIFCMNSSWNFIIYIGLNKNFRDTYKEIMTKCACLSLKALKGNTDN